MGWSRSFRLTSRSPRRRCGRGKLFAPADAFERAMDGAAPVCAQVVVTSIGHWRGEGLALVEAVELRENGMATCVRSSSSPAMAS